MMESRTPNIDIDRAYPYPVVDAAFAEWTQQATTTYDFDDLNVRREPRTSGSCSYIIRHKERIAGEFRLRGVGATGQRTNIAIWLRETGDTEQDRGWLNTFGYLLRQFLEWFDFDQVHAQFGIPDLPQVRPPLPAPYASDCPNPDTDGWKAVFDWYYLYAVPTLNMSVKALAKKLDKGYRTVQTHKEKYDDDHGTSLRPRRQSSA
jgi:hypothetical protein